MRKDNYVQNYAFEFWSDIFHEMTLFFLITYVHLSSLTAVQDCVSYTDIRDLYYFASETKWTQFHDMYPKQSGPDSRLSTSY